MKQEWYDNITHRGQIEGVADNLRGVEFLTMRDLSLYSSSLLSKRNHGIPGLDLPYTKTNAIYISTDHYTMDKMNPLSSQFLTPDGITKYIQNILLFSILYSFLQRPDIIEVRRQLAKVPEMRSRTDQIEPRTHFGTISFLTNAITMFNHSIPIFPIRTGVFSNKVEETHNVKGKYITDYGVLEKIQEFYVDTKRWERESTYKGQFDRMYSAFQTIGLMPIDIYDHQKEELFNTLIAVSKAVWEDPRLKKIPEKKFMGLVKKYKVPRNAAKIFLVFTRNMPTYFFDEPTTSFLQQARNKYSGTNEEIIEAVVKDVQKKRPAFGIRDFYKMAWLTQWTVDGDVYK